MRISTILAIVVCINCIQAQPKILWDKSIGSTAWDDLHSIVPLSDGSGYLICGDISGIDTTPHTPVVTYGEPDYMIARVDVQGNLVWKKALGGSKEDRLWSVIELKDGGFILGGESYSGISGTKKTENLGGIDYWLIKLDSLGNEIWQHSYGGAQNDRLFDVLERPNGDLLLVGFSDSGISGNKTLPSKGKTDGWVLLTDAQGKIKKQYIYGSDKEDNLYTIIPTHDGGYLLGGAVSGGQSATVSQHARGESDYYVVKLNADLGYEWDKRYGGTKDEQIYSITPTLDGGYLIAGASASGISIDKSRQNLGSYDYWIIKVSSNGVKLWDKTIGGQGLDAAYDVVEMPDGNFYVGGVSDSPKSDYKSAPNLGDYDYWLAYFDRGGQIIWDQTYGGPKSDAMTTLRVLPNYGLMMGGHSSSDVSPSKSSQNFGNNDWWIITTPCGTELDLPERVEHCIGAEITLTADLDYCDAPPCTFIWNLDKRTPTLSGYRVNQDGKLLVMMRDYNGCISMDSLEVATDPRYRVWLGNDTIILKDKTLDIRPYNTNLLDPLTYKWSDGSRGQTLTISKTDTYAITVTDQTGCSAIDSIYVCVCAEEQVYLANVIEPDDDLNNDTWFVQCAPGVLTQVKNIIIVDVWGTTVFSAQNIPPNSRDHGWTGDYRGKTVRPGVYTYMVELEYLSGKTETIFGTVTVVH